MRVPTVVAIPIVALCATTGLALGWLFPLTPSHRAGEQSPVTAASQVSAGKVREPIEQLAPQDSDDEDRPAPQFSPTAVPSEELTSTDRIEERKPRPSASERMALPSVAGPAAPAAEQNKTTAPQSASPKSAKSPNPRSTKEAQKATSHRARPGPDSYAGREKQPTPSIISQLPIVGPVFGLLVP
jgi:hypothetical protein